jgi:hypothetical protein
VKGERGNGSGLNGRSANVRQAGSGQPVVAATMLGDGQTVVFVTLPLTFPDPWTAVVAAAEAIDALIELDLLGSLDVDSPSRPPAV